MEKERELQIAKIKGYLKLGFMGVMILFILYVCVEFLPDIIPLLKEGDVEAMEAYVSNAGSKSVIIMVALQVLQTITIVFPGVPIYMAAGVIFGKLKGTILCYITYVVINGAVFLFSRKLGEEADALFSSKGNAEKTTTMRNLLHKTKHPCILVGALCMIPVIPNGLVPHLAAKSTMTFDKFIESVAVGCIPGILLFVACGDLLMSRYFWLIIGLMIFVLVMTVLAFLFKDKMTGWMSRLLKKFFAGKEAE